MKKIVDKQDIANVKIDENDYEIPKDLALSTLGFFVMNSNGVILREANKPSNQVQALLNPKEITEQTLISALTGAQNRSKRFAKIFRWKTGAADFMVD